MAMKTTEIGWIEKNRKKNAEKFVSSEKYITFASAIERDAPLQEDIKRK